MNNIFSFKGRAQRSEYWAVRIPVIIFSRMGELIPESAYDNPALSIGIVILSVLALWIYLATNTRRCHDLGHNGLWQLIPFYGIWMGFVAGQSEDNEYNIEPDAVTA